MFDTSFDLNPTECQEALLVSTTVASFLRYLFSFVRLFSFEDFCLLSVICLLSFFFSSVYPSEEAEMELGGSD